MAFQEKIEEEASINNCDENQVQFSDIQNNPVQKLISKAVYEDISDEMFLEFVTLTYIGCMITSQPLFKQDLNKVDNFKALADQVLLIKQLATDKNLSYFQMHEWITAYVNRRIHNPDNMRWFDRS